MKIIRTSQLIKAEGYYGLNDELFLLDLTSEIFNFSSADFSYQVMDCVWIDGSMLFSFSDGNCSSTISLIAETQKDIHVLMHHRFTADIGRHGLKLLFIPLEEISNLDQEVRNKAIAKKIKQSKEIYDQLKGKQNAESE